MRNRTRSSAFGPRTKPSMYVMPTSTSTAGASGGYHRSIKAIVKVKESEIGYRHRHHLHSLEDALGRRDHFGNGYTFFKKSSQEKLSFGLGQFQPKIDFLRKTRGVCLRLWPLSGRILRQSPGNQVLGLPLYFNGKLVKLPGIVRGRPAVRQ